MKIRVFIAFIFAILFGVLTSEGGKADGIIVPEPPICFPDPCVPPRRSISQLEIRYHNVEVSIDDQIAKTTIDQVLYNPNGYIVEGDYLFPIPKDAAISDFSLWIDGEPVKGEILDAEQAYQTYKQIVFDLQDPALLEYSGQSAVVVHIYPIPAGGERRVSLEYNQVLTSENGLVKYAYPLSTEKFSTRALEEVNINMNIKSRLPIRAVYSPSHQVEVNQLNNYNFQIVYHQENVLPSTDFILYYSIGESDAFHVISFRDPGEFIDPGGFFLMLLAPSPTLETPIIPKNVILVLDRSGSMEGEKFRQAKDALLFILDHLNEQDKFNIVSFSSTVESFSSGLASISDLRYAKSWVERLSAKGSTDINRALLESVSMIESSEPTYMIFITDGLPTEGETDTTKIINNFLEFAPHNLRLFSFGVGYDVDTLLLDTLSDEHQGLSQYVLPEENIDEIVSEFYSRLSTPVMTDLSIDYGNLITYDTYPDPLPDLFLGSQIVITGRYRQGGTFDITINGKVGDEIEELRYVDQFFSIDNSGEIGESSSIPRIWAARKIGYLLNQIRLHGTNQEMINQIVKLSIRYGIITPYTSYLVTDPAPLGFVERERIAAQQFNEMESSPALAYGQDAVEKSIGQSMLENTLSVSEPVVEDKNLVRYVGSRTFIFIDEKWVDTAFDPDLMETEKIQFLSERYFKLARKSAELSASLGLGKNVIVIFEEEALEVVDDNSPIGDVSLYEDIQYSPLGDEFENLPSTWLSKHGIDIIRFLRGIPSPIELILLLKTFIFPG